MKKFRLYLDKDKEEEWLNEMSRQGFAMTGFFAGLYSFTTCEPGEYIYRVDMWRDALRAPAWRNDYQRYVEFVEETGAEYVCRWGFWLIFRKEAAKGEFALYTDRESQIALYRRIRWLFLFLGILELSPAFLNTMNVFHFWESTGGSFTYSFMYVILAAAFICWSLTAGCFLMVLRCTDKIQRLRM